MICAHTIRFVHFMPDVKRKKDRKHLFCNKFIQNRWILLLLLLVDGSWCIYVKVGFIEWIRRNIVVWNDASSIMERWPLSTNMPTNFCTCQQMRECDCAFCDMVFVSNELYAHMRFKWHNTISHLLT